MPQGPDPRDQHDSPDNENDHSEPQNQQEIDNEDSNLPRDLSMGQGPPARARAPTALENLANLLLDAARASSPQPDPHFEIVQAPVQILVEEPGQEEEVIVLYEPPQPMISGESSSRKESETLSRLYSLTMSEVEKLRAELQEQNDPPGRLPVSLVPPNMRDIPFRFASGVLSNPTDPLETRMAMVNFFKRSDFPFEFMPYRNPKNKGLATMTFSAEGVRKALAESSLHVSFFAKALRWQLQSGYAGTRITDEEYSVLFGALREEFAAFRRLVRFAVKGLKDIGFTNGPGVVNALVQLQSEVEDMFAKLEFASLCQKVYRMKRRFFDTRASIGRVQSAIWSVYR